MQASETQEICKEKGGGRGTGLCQSLQPAMVSARTTPPPPYPHPPPPGKGGELERDSLPAGERVTRALGAPRAHPRAALLSSPLLSSPPLSSPLSGAGAGVVEVAGGMVACGRQRLLSSPALSEAVGVTNNVWEDSTQVHRPDRLTEG